MMRFTFKHKYKEPQSRKQTSGSVVANNDFLKSGFNQCIAGGYGYRSTGHYINGPNFNGQTDQLLYTSTKTG
jgi:hypothetical protein